MNVTCDKCGKRYVISDDKVAGKASVKIRCKQCQNLIQVAVAASAPMADGGAAAGRSPWEDESTRAMPPLDTTVQWFAMLGGKQQGPFDLGELQRRVAAGEVTLRTYLWKSGMGDWKRAADVPEVSPIFAGVPAPPRASKPQPAVKDVALANEVPFTSRPTAQSGAGAVVAKNEPLNDLFGDVSALNEQPAPAAEPGHAAQAEAPSQESQQAPGAGEQPFDPFAALSEGDGQEPPPPGEATRFFIAQAGVNKRNPPWKIALFVATFIGGPIALIYVLNTFEIVKMPTVTRTDENGQEVQESFFSAEGVGGLKDLLTGEAKKKRAEAERLRKEQAAAIAARNAKNAAAKPGDPEPEPEVVKPKPQDANLAAFYAEDDRKTRVPKVRNLGEESAPAAVNTSGLSAEAIGKVVADKAKAFQTCIDNALRRNPNLSVGSVTVVLTVGPSGAVKAASIDPKKHEGAEWAQCMMSTGKRIVFPGSDAETEVQLPFKVGVAIAP